MGRHPWFLRITTNTPAIQPPFKIAEAIAIVQEWFKSPAVSIIEPGPRYWQLFRDLLTVGQVEGALVSDAHIAALALENGATVCSTDRDFRRFPGVRVINPLA